MDGLPIELLRGVLASLPARDLSRFAATCRAHEDLTDGVARARCAAVGVATKGLRCDRGWHVPVTAETYDDRPTAGAQRRRRIFWGETDETDTKPTRN